MKVIVNGTATEVADDAKVSALVVENKRSVAVALNDVIVPRGEWNETTLSEGDRVLIIAAAYGG